MQLRRRLCALTACLALSCGRVGFETLPIDADGSDGNAIGDDAGHDPGGDGDGAGDGAGDGDGHRDDAGALALLCNEPGAIVCADFDGNNLPSGASTEVEGSGSIDVTDGVLVARTEAGRSRAVLRLPIGVHTDGSLYLRLRARFPSGFDIDQINFATFTSAQSQGEDVDLNLLGGDRFEVYFATEDRADDAYYTAPRDRFLCLLARLEIADYRGSIAVQVDERSVLERGRRDTLPRGGVREVRVGLDYTSSRQDTAEVHIDDVVVASSPLSGC